MSARTGTTETAGTAGTAGTAEIIGMVETIRTIRPTGTTGTTGTTGAIGRTWRLLIAAAAASCAWLAAGALGASTGRAATVGAPLGQLTANTAEGCEAFVPPSLREVEGVPPMCILLGSDPASGWTSQIPTGNWVIRKASVRTGPRTGRMAFVVIRMMRSQAVPANPPSTPGVPVVGGTICCTIAAESEAFTPAADGVTQVPVSLPAVNTVEDLEGEPVEVVDYLGIAILDLGSSLPVHLASAPQPGSTATTDLLLPSLGFAAPLTPGAELKFEQAHEGVSTLVAGEIEPAPATPGAPTSPATPTAPTTPTAPPVAATPPSNVFSILPGVKLLGRGTRARLGVKLPGPGSLAIISPTRIATRGRAARAAASRRQHKARGHGKQSVITPVRRHFAEAGEARLVIKLTRSGRALLAKRRRLKVPVKLTFTPDGGSPASRKRVIAFRRRGSHKGASASAAARLTAVPSCRAMKRRASRAPSRQSRSRLMREYKRCVQRGKRRQRRANLKVQRLIANSHLVGTRGDGASVDDIYCASGKWRGSTYLRGEGETGISEGKHWWIVKARFHGSDFTALLRGEEGYEIALARRHGQYEYGIAAFGKGIEYGRVTKTDATAECGALG